MRPSSSNQRRRRASNTRFMPATPATRNLRSVASRNQKPVSTVRRKDGLKLLVEFVAGARKSPGCQHTSRLGHRKQAGRFLTGRSGRARRPHEDAGHPGRRPQTPAHSGGAVHAAVPEHGVGRVESSASVRGLPRKPRLAAALSWPRIVARRALRAGLETRVRRAGGRSPRRRARLRSALARTRRLSNR
jgi:hypothetical protein